jgi:hypothetical protein
MYSTVLLLGQQEHYLQGSTRSSSSSSVPLLLLASNHDDDNDNDNDDNYSEASEVSTSIVTSIKVMKEQDRKRRLLAPPTKYQIRALFHLWKHYLISGNIDGLSKRYTTNAILNPMNSMNLDNDNNEEHNSSNTFETFLPLTNSKSIQNYYNELISLYRPTDCRILRSRITIREHISDDDNNNASSYYAQDTGIIEIITFSGQIIHARYTFIYGKCGSSSNNNRWKIVNHTFSKIDINTTTTTNTTSVISGGTIKTNNDNKNGSIIASPTRSTPPQSSSSSSSSPSPLIMSVFQPSLPSITKVTTKATYTPPPPPSSTVTSRRRPSQIDYLVKILTRSQSITQHDLLLFSTTSTTTADSK